jgi:hypothetical protein
VQTTSNSGTSLLLAEINRRLNTNATLKARGALCDEEREEMHLEPIFRMNVLQFNAVFRGTS